MSTNPSGATVSKQVARLGYFTAHEDLFSAALERTAADLRHEVTYRSPEHSATFWRTIRKVELAIIVADWHTAERINDAEAERVSTAQVARSLHACPIHRTYTSGTSYYLVRCDTCRVVLNSGHHYPAEHVHHAYRIADEHNAECHAERTTHKPWCGTPCTRPEHN